MTVQCNIPLQQKSEQDSLRVLWERIERERQERSRELVFRRAVRAISGKATK